MLKDGGHLSHGMKINFSGIFYKPVHYPLHYGKDHAEFEGIDYDAAERVCMEHKPKVLLCGRVFGVSEGDRFRGSGRSRTSAPRCWWRTSRHRGLGGRGRTPEPVPARTW